MIIVRPDDAIHKAQLFRLLTEIIDNKQLSPYLYFKGGTCASMLGILDRFSVDLDFDLKDGVDEKKLRTEFHLLFKSIGFRINDESKKSLEFFLKYPSANGKRNSLKIDALNIFVKANKYEPQYLAEIDRTIVCQTKDTIFANKLVAVWDRYKKHKYIVGRDIYDIHYFFLNGLPYNTDVIVERTGLQPVEYFKKIRKLIQIYLTDTIISQDLNLLLPYDKFKKVRAYLKKEVLNFLDEEIYRKEI